MTNHTDETDDYDPGVFIGNAYIQCPECDTSIAVPVKAQISRLENGNQTLITDPDMTDLWAHSWTHGDDTWVKAQYDND